MLLVAELDRAEALKMGHSKEVSKVLPSVAMMAHMSAVVMDLQWVANLAQLLVAHLVDMTVDSLAGQSGYGWVEVSAASSAGDWVDG